jgi:DNA repair exonuclease SbcCD ATPase subunit
VLSFVFLIDHIGTMERKNLLKELPPDYLEQMALKIPENLSKLLSDAVTTLLDRFGAEKSEIAEITDYIKKKEIVTMFEAMVERHFKLREEGYNEAKAEDREQLAAKDERIRQDQEQIQQDREQIRQDREQIRQDREQIRQLEEQIRRLRGASAP